MLLVVMQIKLLWGSSMRHTEKNDHMGKKRLAVCARVARSTGTERVRGRVHPSRGCYRRSVDGSARCVGMLHAAVCTYVQYTVQSSTPHIPATSTVLAVLHAVVRAYVRTCRTQHIPDTSAERAHISPKRTHTRPAGDLCTTPTGR